MEDIGDVIDPLNKTFWWMPFFRAQILMQTQDLIPSFKKSPPLNGFMDTFRRICRYESFAHLWRGGSAYFYHHAIYLLFNRAVMPKINKINDSQKESWLKRFIGNPDPLISAAIIAWNLVFHPLEVLRVRMICQDFGLRQQTFQTVPSTIKDIMFTEGIRGFYRGYVPITTYMIIQQDMFDPVIEGTANDSKTNFAFRMLRDISLYPLMVVGHRMIIDVPKTENSFKTIREQFKCTLERIGFKGFYRGFQLNLFIHSMNSSVVFFSRGAWAEKKT